MADIGHLRNALPLVRRIAEVAHRMATAQTAGDQATVEWLQEQLDASYEALHTYLSAVGWQPPLEAEAEQPIDVRGQQPEYEHAGFSRALTFRRGVRR